MRCDVLAIGTELLLGQIIDSNSAWMGEQLAAHGYDSLVQVKVGDNIDRIIAMLRRILDALSLDQARADAVEIGVAKLADATSEAWMTRFRAL